MHYHLLAVLELGLLQRCGSLANLSQLVGLHAFQEAHGLLAGVL